MRCATFNVLADAYTGYGDYSHVDPQLLLPGARVEGIVRLVEGLDADVVGLQEADEPLVRAMGATGIWQTFWSPKGRNKPDGCLTLVKHGIEVSNFDTHLYGDGSGHVVQAVDISGATFANTHIKWAPIDDPEHAGVAQTEELIDYLAGKERAVIFADCNDRPNGPVRQLVEAAGFVNEHNDDPTAIVNQELVALDLLAVRGMSATRIPKHFDLTRIPNAECPSDHIPIVADVLV